MKKCIVLIKAIGSSDAFWGYLVWGVTKKYGREEKYNSR